MNHLSVKTSVLGLVIALSGCTTHPIQEEKVTTTHTMTMAEGYKAFQMDADIVRLRHLRHWVGLIEQYHAKTGKYPLQGVSKYPNYVFVATPRQQKKSH